MTRLLESIALRLETAPWSWIYRIAIGFLSAAGAVRIGGAHPGRSLATSLVLVFLLLRLVPAVVRRRLRFSEAARSVWAERRQMAKRYDCYQWRKLFWIGVGVAVAVLLSSRFVPSVGLVTSACLFGGALGMIRWHVVAGGSAPEEALSPAGSPAPQADKARGVPNG